MCYREPPDLDLEPIQVACLCGPNGHGKSALLDAITWALWGQARARTQDELIHQGQTDMAVELDFSARNRRYRVSRRHSCKRGKQGATILELQVASNGSYTPITGNTVRETESAIRELLHMDYDTFVNTAFLLQGRADMFTAATPSKRKEVLVEVLDLGYYESLAVKARERGRERERRIADIDATVAAHSPEIACKPQYLSDLSDVEARLRGLDSELTPARKALVGLRADVDRLRGWRSDLDATEVRLAAARKDLDDLEVRANSQRSRLADLEMLAERSEEIERGVADLKTVKTTVDSLDRALTLLSELERQRAEAEKELAVRRERVSAELDRERARLTETQAAADRLSQLEAALAALCDDRERSTALERQAEERRVELSSLKAEVQVLELGCSDLLARMKRTREQFDLLEDGVSQCPVCKQPLGDEGADHLRVEYEREGTNAKRLYSENRARTKQVADQNGLAEAALATAVAQATAIGQDVERRAAILDRDLTLARQAVTELDGVRARAARIEVALTTADFGEDLSRRLAEVDAQLVELGYDPEAHQAARNKASELEPFAKLHPSLLDTVTALPDERQALESTVAMADRRRRDIGRDEQASGELAKGLEGLPAMEKEMAAASQRAAELESRTAALNESIGGLRERISRCEYLENEVDAQLERRRTDAEEHSIYDELARAFGKNGIQALVIETAIPRIAAEASVLLGQLSDGRMSLRLNLTAGRRERRTGEPAEQLDIQVADEMGTRSYETFSGGEAFRINFAIRIALSKLLAGRSGAPLPILFIDEGFGSQDETGQDRLREAINHIQDEFQKVLVITHIDALKDSFPVRIEVEKTAAGSTFTVT